MEPARAGRKGRVATANERLDGCRTGLLRQAIQNSKGTPDSGALSAGEVSWAHECDNAPSSGAAKGDRQLLSDMRMSDGNGYRNYWE
eukprot:2361418-Pyramimonas_sp.AAC.1